MIVSFEEVEKQIIKWLNQHLQPINKNTPPDTSNKYIPRDKARGSIYQDPYISDFYKLFLNAFCMGTIQPSDYFRERAYNSLQYGTEAAKNDLLEKFCIMWDDWKYALEEGIKLEKILKHNT
jgi:hypothetical protein